MNPILKHIQESTKIPAYLEWEYVNGLSETLNIKDGRISIISIFARPNNVHMIIWNDDDIGRPRRENIPLADPEAFDKIDRTIRIRMAIS
jgi:hypothetical protein